MPYITQDKRDLLDPIVDQLHKAIIDMELDIPDVNTEGNMNYIISSLIHKVYNTTNYKAINDVMGLLSSVKAEYYNRVAVPYEAQKCHDHGDVYD